jgi:hypothetical protein
MMEWRWERNYVFGNGRVLEVWEHEHGYRSEQISGNDKTRLFEKRNVQARFPEGLQWTKL